VHRLNPVTKLIALVTVIVIVFAVSVWWMSLGVILIIVTPAAVVAHVGRRLLAISLKILLPLVTLLFIVNGLTYPGDHVLWRWGFLHVTTAGLMFAVNIGSRIVALVLSSVLLVITTHPGDLMSALTERGMSAKFSYIISSTLQLVPAFQARANSILLAQQARGLVLPRNRLRRIKAIFPLVGPLVLGTFTDVEERSTAMEARGFGSTARRTSLIPVADSAGQRVARWSMPVLAAAAIVLPHVVSLP
jgi:energy-coupling factor transport system permease protein